MSSARKGLRRAGVGSLSALLAATAMTGLASTASATTDATFTRVQGEAPNANRYGTAAKVADLFGTTTDVILASGEPGHTVDALSASVLAGFKNAPILLTKQAATPQVVLDQIKKSGASTVWIVGGESAVSSAQEQALKTAGYAVSRLSGNDRWGTAADIINHSGKSTTALIATGLDFPDALGGGALSYAAGFPIGLVKRDSVPNETLTALQNAGVKDVIILGGEGVVSPTVVTQLNGAGITVKARMNGANRAETSALLAQYEVDNYGFTDTQANIASGYAFGDGADALGGAAFSGEKNTPLLITKNATQADELATWLRAHAATVASGYVFGGPAAVADALVDKLEAAAQDVTTNQTLVVSPSTKATNTASTAAAPNAGARTYSVAGLDATKTYTVALFDAGNVVTDSKSGHVSFADADFGGSGDGLADGIGATAGAQIEQVNGSGIVAATTTTSKPAADGTLTFVVDSTVADDVVPVVFLDANSNSQLDLNADNEPTEDFGVGGETVFTPAEGVDGPIAAGNVASVDKAANSFVQGNATYFYDAGDTFKIGGVAASQAAFEAALSTGDTVSGTYANQNDTTPTGASSFDLTDVTPTDVGAVTATPAADSIKLSWADMDDVDSFNVYRIAGPSASTDLTKFTLVGTVSPDSNADADTFTDKDVTASTEYRYAVTSVLDGDESDANFVDTATIGAAPLANDATVTADNDEAAPPAFHAADGYYSGSDGDTLRIVFDQPIAVSASPIVQVKDSQGDTANLTGDALTGNATFDVNPNSVAIAGVTYKPGQVLTITGTAAPTVTAGSSGDGILDYALTVTNASGVANANGAWKPATAGQDVTLEATGDTSAESTDTVALLSGADLTTNAGGSTGFDAVGDVMTLTYSSNIGLVGITAGQKITEAQFEAITGVDVAFHTDTTITIGATASTLTFTIGGDSLQTGIAATAPVPGAISSYVRDAASGDSAGIQGTAPTL